MLTSDDRANVAAEFMRTASGDFAFTTPHLDIAIAAVDEWMESLAGAIDRAFPDSFVKVTTVGQRLLLAGMMVGKRITEVG